MGYLSNFWGRRFCLLLTCVIAGALLYPYCYLTDKSINAAAFFELFGVQGGWGIIPSHMLELSPPGLATFFLGTTYQLGNLISSASTTIEATAAAKYPLPPHGKTKRYDYGKVICILMAAVLSYIALLTFVGPEKLGQSTAVEDDSDMIEVAGRDKIEHALHDDESLEHVGNHTQQHPSEKV